MGTTHLPVGTTERATKTVSINRKSLMKIRRNPQAQTNFKRRVIYLPWFKRAVKRTPRIPPKTRTPATPTKVKSIRATPVTTVQMLLR